jgi:hypothetical protein
MDSRAVLFPLMLIAAIAVIAFSAISTLTMLGWTPDTLSSTQPVSRAVAAEVMPKTMREAIAPCADCGPAARKDGVQVRNASPRG